MTRRLHKIARRETDYSDQKQYRQHKHQQKKQPENKNGNKNQLYGHFKQHISEISHEKTWKWLRKGNLKRERESVLIAAQNNTIRTNYVKARIDKTQQNSRCRLYGD